MLSGLLLALLKPAALSAPPLPDPPLSLLLLLKCILCLVFVILFKLFIAWQCCHDESWYHGTSLNMDCKYEPYVKVRLTSPPSPREKEATAQATPKR